MNVIKSLWTSFKKHVWDVIPLWLWIIIVAVALAAMCYSGKMNTLSTCDMIQLVLFLILTQVIFIVTAHNVYFSDASKQNSNTSKQKKELPFKLIIMGCGVLVFMSMTFIWIMFSEYMLQLVSNWLGTKCDRAKTLSSIGYGMGGILAAMGAIAIYRRADADVENNKLTEKGYIYEHAQYAINRLESENLKTRILSFYQFFHLALESKDSAFKQNILDMLCVYLHNMTTDKSYQEEKSPSRECQILLNLLFVSGNPQVFRELKADLRDCHFVGAEFTKAIPPKDTIFIGANLHRANFIQANMININFHLANLAEANLSEAKLSNANLSYTDLSKAKLSKAKLSKANLSKANLAEANLVEANLSCTNLSGANLVEADLAEAHLSCTNLSGANLSKADLAKANLEEANLSFADLSNANLAKANLEEANLSYADLSNANLSKANLSETNLSNANLAEANLAEANFQKAQLKNVKFDQVLSIQEADFRKAKIGSRPIERSDLPTDKGHFKI